MSITNCSARRSFDVWPINLSVQGGASVFADTIRETRARLEQSTRDGGRAESTSRIVALVALAVCVPPGLMMALLRRNPMLGMRY